MSEPALKDAFIRDFSDDFAIHKDVPGQSVVENKWTGQPFVDT